MKVLAKADHPGIYIVYYGYPTEMRETETVMIYCGSFDDCVDVIETQYSKLKEDASIINLRMNEEHTGFKGVVCYHDYRAKFMYYMAPAPTEKPQ